MSTFERGISMWDNLLGGCDGLKGFLASESASAPIPLKVQAYYPKLMLRVLLRRKAYTWTPKVCKIMDQAV